MKTRLLAAVAATAALALASSASAGVLSIQAVNGNAVPTGMTLITDFNSTGGTDPSSQGGSITDLADFYTFTQDANAYTRDGGAGLDPGISAPPPLNNLIPGAYYETVLAGGQATLTSAKGLKTFSFYMGSPDWYNHVTFTFYGMNGGVQTLNGTEIWGGSPPGDGNQANGFTIIYKFGPEAVNKVVFTNTDSNAFEFDRLAGIEVPEPATWAMMLMGFGGIGAMIRRRRAALAFA